MWRKRELCIFRCVASAAHFFDFGGKNGRTVFYTALDSGCYRADNLSVPVSYRCSDGAEENPAYSSGRKGYS